MTVACATEDTVADCESATRHVSSCYGDEVGQAFAATCTAEAAATALEESCPGADGGKEDAFSAPILNPPVEHFKYGSIGADKLGLPVALMRALPIVCADKLPAGTDPRNRPLEAFGMIYEDGHDLPIGFSEKRVPLIGMKLAGTTCSTCHTATVRETANGPRTLYFGAPNQRFDVQKYNDFLLGCISDTSKFNKTNIDRAFRELGVTGIERMLAFSTSFIRAFVSDLDTKVHSIVADGPWGPGRDDAIGLSAVILLGEEFTPTIPAPIDYPAVWNQDARKGHSLHWDGASGSAVERNVLVSVGAGTPRDMVPLQSIAAIQSFLDKLPAPKYPYAIDQTKVARGAQLFGQFCASCHAPDGARTWSVIPLAEVGTDPNRVEVVTQAGVDKLNSMSGAGWKFDSFKKTNGYLSNILDGIWLRAPYLHNGSVPTLRALLDAPSQRPAAFFRGSDTYDKVNVGFVSNVASEGNARYMRFDTTLDGNSNSGHAGAEYGTNLPAADKDALVEYLKTL
jgi:mono/diheme cytochrome c family protein